MKPRFYRVLALSGGASLLLCVAGCDAVNRNLAASWYVVPTAVSPTASTDGNATRDTTTYVGKGYVAVVNRRASKRPPGIDYIKVDDGRRVDRSGASLNIGQVIVAPFDLAKCKVPVRIEIGVKGRKPQLVPLKIGPPSSLPEEWLDCPPTNSVTPRPSAAP